MKKIFVLVLCSIWFSCLASGWKKKNTKNQNSFEVFFNTILAKNVYCPDDSLRKFNEKKENVISLLFGDLAPNIKNFEEILKKSGWAIVHANNKKGFDLRPFKWITESMVYYTQNDRKLGSVLCLNSMAKKRGARRCLSMFNR